MAHSPVNFTKILQIIEKRRFIIISAAVLFFICSTAYAVWKTFTPLYTSTCSIKYEKNLTLGDLFTRALSLPEGDNIETQKEIITSYPLLLEIAKNLSLVTQTASVDDPDMVSIVEDLKRKINVDRKKNTSIINISVTESDPAFAQRFVNELVNIYCRYYSDQQEKQLNEVIKYINDQLRANKNKLEKSEEQFSRFSQDYQLISIDLQGDNLLSRKNELEEKIRIETDKKKVNDLKIELKELDEKIEFLMRKKPEFNRLKREIESFRSMISFLEEKNQEVMIKKAEKPNEIVIIKSAPLPTRRVNPPKFVRTCLTGIFAGIVFGLVIAFLFEVFGSSTGIIEDIEETLDVKIIGIIPRSGIQEILPSIPKKMKKESDESLYSGYINLVSHFAPRTIIAESYRALRTNIQFTREKEKTRTIAVTGSSPHEEKSKVSVNLAISMAQAGLKTLLVSADIKNPMPAKIFNIVNHPGLIDILTGTCLWPDAIRTVTDMIIGGLSIDDVMMTPGLDKLNIITSGDLPPNSAELINSQKFTDFLEEVKNEYDIIILDSSPLLSKTDAAVLGTKVDAVLIVHNPGTASKEMLKRTITQLKQVDGYLMGVVLNGVKPDFVPDALRQKYSKHLLPSVETKLNPLRVNRSIKILIPFAGLVLLISGIWWQKDKIFPGRFSSSEVSVEKVIKSPQKTEHVQKEIVTGNEYTEEKRKVSSVVKEPEQIAPETSEPIDKIDTEDSTPEKAKPEYIEGRYPYSIYLGSYKNTERGEKALDLYARRGISSYMVRVDFDEKGIWYRVYSGYYPDSESARAFIEDNNIKDAEIKKTAYACYIDSYMDNERLESQMNILKEKHYSPYVIGDDALNLNTLLVGAYITRNAAEELSEELHSLGIENKVVSR